MSHVLSKSTFVRGNQCEKSLYLNRHHKELRDEIDAAQEAVFAQGTEVGLLARTLFPGGVDVSPAEGFAFAESVTLTAAELKKGTRVLYEPAFLHDEVLAAMDILVRTPGGYTAYEVKSSTGVSPAYILDAALQYYVISGTGLKLNDIFIVHISNQYVRGGKTEVEKLFTRVSVLKEVKALQKEIPARIRAMKKVLRAGTVPAVEIGPHCHEPYACDFHGHCWKHVPEKSIFSLSNMRSDKKWQLYERGIVGFDHIDLKTENDFLNEKQRMQLQAERTRESFINKKEIAAFVKDLQYPLYFLDFETFQLAIPVLNGTRPYQQLPFQYSLHVIERPGGKTQHHEFLALSDGSDPRPAFIRQLIGDCGRTGDILVYNIGFERGKINALIRDFPGFEKPLQKIVGRLKDLMVPFQKKWYYVPAMNGSYSIKHVLPALVPELSYDDLEIGNGGTASNTFSAMMSGTFPGNVAAARKALLDYCKMDTWAMVKLYGKLKMIK